jgi:peptide/nickel transport system permease protein
MDFHFIIFWTDALIFLLVFFIVATIFGMLRQEYWRQSLQRVGRSKLGMIALVILLTYSIIGLLDSIHFKTPSLGIESLLDIVVSPLGTQDEQTYSVPFALNLSIKATEVVNGVQKTVYPRLVYGGAHLVSPANRCHDILTKTLFAIAQGLFVGLLALVALIFALSRLHKKPWLQTLKSTLKGQTKLAWRELIVTAWIIVTVIFFAENLATHYHILGTDKVGKDIFYEAIKSIRTGLVIGTLTTLVMLPFAVLLGTEAGYFGGWLDDLIQYIYTTLSSIPGVLLISAAVLSLQIFITNHPALFPTLESRADARLLALCIILGVTSWTSLCRLLRAETLKLREIDFVRAAISLGVTNFKIILRHILPNVMHIILITTVLDFSGLVLAEAVLSYVGVGVDPTTMSWGNMINSARLDLAREPVVWWPLLAAFIFMFTLVLAANLFADAVRDAFDPHLREVA